MPSYSAIDTIVRLTDLMIAITLLTVWLALRRSRVAGPAGWHMAIPIALTLGWGALWAFVPAMAALRFLPPPSGQAAAILALVVGLCAVLLIPAGRRFFRAARPLPLVALGPWRMVYGLALLAVGLLGGLPPAFFWSAAFGDIAVGLWSLAILARHSSVTDREIVSWNIIGFADLAHVLALGAANLRGFYLADPAISPLNLLPLAGVPMFLALHALTLWGYWERRSLGRTVTA